MNTFLITSAAYCGSEFIAEFGLLPPAFLPIGNRRLFEMQSNLICSASPQRTILSIPDDFFIDDLDVNLLDTVGIEIYRVPIGMSLADSILYTINIAAVDEGELRILHGDTLIKDVNFQETDVVSVGYTNDYYSWADWKGGEYYNDDNHEKIVNDSRLVMTGYFSFSSCRLVVQAMSLARGDFIAGIATYNNSRKLRKLSTGMWLDFGHIQTYYHSRTQITTERAFNALCILPRVVKKSSVQTSKILAEASWYVDVPSTIKPFLPQFIEKEEPSADNNASYTIEYLQLLPLNDLFVYGRLPRVVWRAIFRACDTFLTTCGEYRPVNANCHAHSANKLYIDKTILRLEQFCTSTGISLEKEWIFNDRKTPSLLRIATETAACLRQTSASDICIVHGDFCLSNILYDFRSQTLKTIDPRGIGADGSVTIFGDQRYDIAKLYHSIIGYYDLIISGRHEFKYEGGNRLALYFPTNTHIRDVQSVFLESSFNGNTFSSADSLPISILFFLSMLPLHYDHPERQRALMANAIRLYIDLTGDFS